MKSKIIIVGSGSSVLDKELGKKIDSFDIVVRLNNYEIKGYEKYVGSKTTIWGRNNSNRTIDRDCSIYSQVIIASPPKDFSGKKNYSSALELHRSIKNSIMVKEGVKNDLQKFLKLSGERRGHNLLINKRVRIGNKKGWPSTGLMIVAHFLDIQNEPLTLYGFDNFKMIDGGPRHYYNDIEVMPTSKMHQGDREKSYIDDMIRSKRIVLLQ